MKPFVLRARWVLPIDREPIEHGYVAVAGERILSVGAGRPDGAAVVELGDAILTPGLVNAHAHLEFSNLRAPLGERGLALPEWIRRVIAERKRADRDVAAAIAAGLAESLSAGVTTIGEIATASAACYRAPGFAPTLMLLQEAIGFSTPRVESSLADVEARLAAAADFRVGVSPHAPYTTNPRLVERLATIAAERDLPVAMHLAESREELEFLATGSGPFRDLLEERSMWDPTTIALGSRPLDYLQILAGGGSPRFAPPKTLVIHGNYLAPDEIKFLGNHRENMSVVYCPRTHAQFGHDEYPLAALAAAGVRVVLGTDSRASNPDLDVLAEARFAAKRFPTVDAHDWLQAVTLGAAESLGLGERSGSLTPGKQADLVAWSCDGSERDPEAALITGPPRRPAGVWIAGARAGIAS